MVLFESLQSNYFEKLGLKLSIKLDNTINVLYHHDKKVTNELINVFNNSSTITYGSLIIDDILIQDLEIKDRNTFFYNNISYLTTQNINNNLTVIKNINKWVKLFNMKLDEKVINDFFDYFNLDDLKDVKVKKINDENKTLIAFLMSILKIPKYVIYQYETNIDLNKIESFLFKHKLDIKIIILTNNLISYKLYNLNDQQYYQNNPIMTFYTKQNVRNFSYKKTKNNFNIFFFIFQKTQFRNKLFFLLSMILATLLLCISFSFNYMNNKPYNYAIVYLLIILTIVLSFFSFTFQIFFKNKENLTNLNIEGFNHVFIVMSTIFVSMITNLLPLLFSTIIIVILKYTTNLMVNVDIINIYIPILVFFTIVLTTTLLSSMKLRIDINK